MRLLIEPTRSTRYTPPPAAVAAQIAKADARRHAQRIWAEAKRILARCWPDRATRAVLVMEASRLLGLELARRGQAFGEPPPAIVAVKETCPLLDALTSSPEITAIAGRVSLDPNAGRDEEVQTWAQSKIQGSQATVSIYSRVGRDAAAALAVAGERALRERGWRIRGAGPTIVKAPGLVSGIWVAHLALAKLSPAKGEGLTLGR